MRIVLLIIAIMIPAFIFGLSLQPTGDKGYTDISAVELKTMLNEKDFTLIDVHIPEQQHIEGTDLLIPYNEIGNSLYKLPSDKSAKIVLYCRSGSMSSETAAFLAEQGYTNVYNLENGIKEWRALGYTVTAL